MAGDNTPEFDWRELAIAGVQALDEVSRKIAAAVAELLSDREFWLEAAQPFIARLGEAALEVRDAFDEGVPSGWSALTVNEMVEVVDLMRETGWCLTTSPPAGILKELLVAPSADARSQLLLDAEGQILHDLDLELRSAEDHEHPLFADALRQSWDAHAGGLFLASQALSAAVLGSLSDRRGPLPFKSLGAARTYLSSLNIEDAGIREFRFVAVAGAAATALDTFPRQGREPTGFNRHASAHGLSRVQYTQLNSLTALMLTCGWLREIFWLIRVARLQSSG